MLRIGVWSKARAGSPKQRFSLGRAVGAPRPKSRLERLGRAVSRALESLPQVVKGLGSLIVLLTLGVVAKRAVDLSRLDALIQPFVLSDAVKDRGATELSVAEAVITRARNLMDAVEYAEVSQLTNDNTIQSGVFRASARLSQHLKVASTIADFQFQVPGISFSADQLELFLLRALALPEPPKLAGQVGLVASDRIELSVSLNGTPAFSALSGRLDDLEHLARRAGDELAPYLLTRDKPLARVIQISQTLRSQGYYEAAESCMRIHASHSTIKPSAASLNEWGVALFFLGRYDESLQKLELARRAMSDEDKEEPVAQAGDSNGGRITESELTQNECYALLRLGRARDARERLVLAEQRGVPHGYLHFEYADVSRALGAPEEAIEELTQRVEELKELPHGVPVAMRDLTAELIRVQLALAQSYYEGRKPREGDAHFGVAYDAAGAQAFELGAGARIAVLLEWARVELQQRELVLAQDKIDQILRLEPLHAQTLLLLAQLREERGDPAEAVRSGYLQVHEALSGRIRRETSEERDLRLGALQALCRLALTDDAAPCLALTSEGTVGRMLRAAVREPASPPAVENRLHAIETLLDEDSGGRAPREELQRRRSNFLGIVGREHLALAALQRLEVDSTVTWDAGTDAVDARTMLGLYDLKRAAPATAASTPPSLRALWSASSAYWAGDLELAERMGREAVRLQPRWGEALHILAQALAKRGKVEEALRIAAELKDRHNGTGGPALWAWLRLERLANEVVPGSDILVDIEWLFRVPASRRPELKEVVNVLLQALKLNSNDCDIWGALATAYMARGDIPVAAAMLAEARSVLPHDWMILSKSAIALTLLGNTREAVLQLKRAQDLAPYEPITYLLLANIWKRVHAPSVARRCLSLVEALDPEGVSGIRARTIAKTIGVGGENRPTQFGLPTFGYCASTILGPPDRDDERRPESSATAEK